MARMQWTPIVAPADLADSALRLQALSGSALDKAFSGFGSVLNQYEDQRRDSNLTDLLARQNAFSATNDVAGYQKQLADGTLVGDLRFLKPADIAAARSFTGDLRTARAADTTFARGEEAYARDTADRNSGILVAREGQRIEAAVRAGQMTPQEGVAAAAELANSTQNAAQIAAAYGSVDRGITENRGDVQYGDTRQDRGFMLEDREASRTAAATVEKYRGLGGTFSDLEASDDWKKATPQARILMRNAFGSTAVAPNAFGGVTLAEPTRIMNYEARAAGIDTLPDTVQTLGQASEFAKSVNARGVKSSAMGTFQITGQTLRDFAPKVFGAGWENMSWDAASEDRLGKAIFEASKGSPQALANRWVSLSQTEAAQVAKMPWEEARRVIAQKESGARMPSVGQNQALATQSVVNASSQIGTDRNGWMANLPTAFADDSSLVAVAERVTGAGSKDTPNASPLAGQDRVTVQKELRRVQDQYEKLHPGKTLKPAAAAIILEQSAKPYSGMDWLQPFSKRTLGGRGTLNSFKGDQFVVDDQLLKTTLAAIRFDANGNVAGLNDRVTRRAGSQQDISQAQATLAQVEALRSQLLAQRAEDNRLRRFGNPVTDRLEQQYQLAQAQFDQINGIAAARARASGGR